MKQPDLGLAGDPDRSVALRDALHIPDYLKGCARRLSSSLLAIAALRVIPASGIARGRLNRGS